MIHAPDIPEPDPNIPILPHWIMDGRAAQTLENAGFAAGSALALLHAVLNDPHLQVPTKLLTGKFALKAVVRCLRLDRRGENEASVLDAYLLTKPGDAMGPGGDMLAFWTKASSIKIGPQGWQNRFMPLIPEHMRNDVYGWLDFERDGSGSQSPVAAATDLLQKCFEAYPRDEVVAFLLADIRMAHELRWPTLFPFMAQHLTAKHLRGSRDELLLDAHLAVATVAQNAVRLSYDLARRSARLRAIAPKLRAKGSDAALVLFLSEVAVSPSSMLAARIKGTDVPMTGRAARRFCDRLVELGVIKELTGRSTFRLYGVSG
ncbi:MAG: DUF1403 family protein [Roseovarius sp.]|nr:DUF1403 family protein [Roseovarius sp.]